MSLAFGAGLDFPTTQHSSDHLFFVGVSNFTDFEKMSDTKFKRSRTKRATTTMGLGLFLEKEVERTPYFL